MQGRDKTPQCSGQKMGPQMPRHVGKAALAGHDTGGMSSLAGPGHQRAGPETGELESCSPAPLQTPIARTQLEIFQQERCWLQKRGSHRTPLASSPKSAEGASSPVAAPNPPSLLPGQETQHLLQQHLGKTSPAGWITPAVNTQITERFKASRCI